MHARVCVHMKPWPHPQPPPHAGCTCVGWAPGAILTKRHLHLSLNVRLCLDPDPLPNKNVSLQSTCVMWPKCNDVCTPNPQKCGVCMHTHVRKGDPITSYLCSGGLIRGAYHNILKFNYNLYSSSLDVYQKRCVLYKLLISLRCMNESPTVAACVSTGSRRCVYKSFSLSRFTR